eukprot:INCI21.1.p1 GENE.INCI21.1~~INCI21.1.p1  ORF type:complete len:445 (-),score=50.92 INCI21.1:1065-2228(-)
MSHERYRRRADEAWEKRAALVRKLRQDAWEAKKKCQLRPDVASPAVPWDKTTSVKRGADRSHLINQRIGQFVEPPRGRYVSSYYEGYYTSPFSHKHRRGINAADRIVQDRLQTAHIASRLKTTAECADVDTRGGAGGHGGGSNTALRSWSHMREHYKTHGPPLDVFDAALCSLPDQLRLEDSAKSASTSPPRPRNGALSSAHGSPWEQGGESAIPVSLNSRKVASSPLDHSRSSTNQSLLDSQSTPLSLRARLVDQPGPSEGRRWLIEDVEEELQQAAAAAIEQSSPLTGYSEIDKMTTDSARERKSSNSSPSDRSLGASAMDCSSFQQVSHSSYNRHTSGDFETSRRGNGRSRGIESRDPEAIAAHYYQQLIDECPPDRLFEELYK